MKFRVRSGWNHSEQDPIATSARVQIATKRFCAGTSNMFKKHRTSSVRVTTLAIGLQLLILAACVLLVLVPGKPCRHKLLTNIGDMSASPATSATVVSSHEPLEQWHQVSAFPGLQAWGVGGCAGPWLPASLCDQVYCIRSHREPNMYIDLSLNLFRPMSSNEIMGSTCHEPVGGQHGSKFDPLVSFIISFKDRAEGTVQCIAELFRTAREASSVEFVLVNDASESDIHLVTMAVETIRSHFGVKATLLHNNRSLGFGDSNNIAAHASTGKYLAFINNDAYVTRGWLKSLLSTVEHTPSIGMVGPLFLDSSGYVMEAGGVVWSDSTAANFGRSLRPNHEHLYRRRVDYISAACILVPADVFAQVGGFQAVYGKGYWEDTDLAFAIKSLGRDIVFQPASVVVHNEGGSLSAEKERLMHTNKMYFAWKWKATLEAMHCPKHTSLGDAAIRLYQGRRMLWVDDIVPEIDRDSGSLRTWNIMRIMMRLGYHIQFQAMTKRSNPIYIDKARLEGIDVLPIVHSSLIMHSVTKCPYDVIVVARFYIYLQVKHVVKLHCPHVPIIFDTVDIHFLREARMSLSSIQPPGRWDFNSTDIDHVIAWLASTNAQAAQVTRRRDYEIDLMRTSTITLVVSRTEQQLLARLAPDVNVQIVSNVHDFNSTSLTPQGCAHRTGILFVGNFNHQPNQQAVSILINEILPEVYVQMPVPLRSGMRLHIVGSNRSPDVSFRGAKVPVTFHGWLSDMELQLLYRSVKAVVAPLLSGAGVKGKVNQAMIQGVPVVATPVAAEGMHLLDRQNAMIARSAAEFANKILELYTNCSAWEQVVAGGYRNVQQYFSFETATIQLAKILSNLGLPTNSTQPACRTAT